MPFVACPMENFRSLLKLARFVDEKRNAHGSKVRDGRRLVQLVPCPEMSSGSARPVLLGPRASQAVEHEAIALALQHHRPAEGVTLLMSIAVGQQNWRDALSAGPDGAMVAPFLEAVQLDQQLKLLEQNIRLLTLSARIARTFGLGPELGAVGMLAALHSLALRDFATMAKSILHPERATKPCPPLEPLVKTLAQAGVVSGAAEGSAPIGKAAIAVLRRARKEEMREKAEIRYTKRMRVLAARMDANAQQWTRVAAHLTPRDLQTHTAFRWDGIDHARGVPAARPAARTREDRKKNAAGQVHCAPTTRRTPTNPLDRAGCRWR